VEHLLRWLGESDQAHILCAGRHQQPTTEDTLLAGALVAEVLRQRKAETSDGPLSLKSSAPEALALWQQVAGELQLDPARWSPQATRRLAAWLQEHTPGGRGVVQVGQGEDLLLCAQLNRTPVVPHVVPGNPWTIRLEETPSQSTPPSP